MTNRAAGIRQDRRWFVTTDAESFGRVGGCAAGRLEFIQRMSQRISAASLDERHVTAENHCTPRSSVG
jgi:hypothetical protein